MKIKNVINKFRFKKYDLTPINLDLFSFMVTTNCTLKCKGCDNFIDHYENPTTPEPNTLINDAKSLLECVNRIEMFKIIGGEPFLNRDLDLLIEYLFEGEFAYKIGIVRIITNGTVIPSKKTLKMMEKHKDRLNVFVTIYGECSEKILQILEEYNIKYEKSDENAEWRDSGNTLNRHRDEETLKEFYNNCFSKDMCNCCFNGEYHICPRSAHAKDLGLIPDFKNDYVNLREKSVEYRINKLNHLKNRSYINCCNHCDLPLMKVVKRKIDMH